MVDSSIYVANSASPNNNLALYSPGANGDVGPTATLSNPATGVNDPTGMAIDASGKTYIANSFSSIGQLSGSVTIYPSGNYGADVPSATIMGADTGLVSPDGIALDSSSDIYVSNEYGGANQQGTVTVYAAGSAGNVMPTATIVASNTGSPSNTSFYPTGIAVDASGNIYVLTYCTSGATGAGYCVDVFPPGSNGTVNPNSVIIGQLNQPSGIVLDSDGNIYVANKGNDSIAVYAAGSSGNVAPLAVISGSDTGLFSPGGIGVDSGGNIYVANSSDSSGGPAGSVTVYAPEQRKRGTRTDYIRFLHSALDSHGACARFNRTIAGPLSRVQRAHGDGLIPTRDEP